jgi:uncharacterized membrane protein YecN with MAPEG domain
MQDTHVLILTTGILGVIFFALTIWVVTYRNKTKLMLGDGTGTGLPDAQGLQIAVRAHANFAEYVPMILIILACLAHEGARSTFFLVLCGALVLGRILHPIGIRTLKPNVPRAVGAMLTWAVLIISSIAAIVLAFSPPV